MFKIKNFLKVVFANHVVINVLVLLFCALVLTLSIRGNAGNPTAMQLNTNAWKESGPLELSPERGRFALLYAVAEQKSFTFTPELARFVAPDVGYLNGHYVSLFAPTVSFLTIPGYIAGKYFGASQVGAFAMIALFAIFNVFLIRSIAVRLGATSLAGTIAALTFLFATPAFAYAVTLYQHHISTFLILASIFLLVRFRSVWSLIAIWIMCGLSITVDYPNLFMMLPIGIAALGRTFLLERFQGKISIRVPLMRVLAIAAVVIPMGFFLLYNQQAFGSPTQLSGTIDRSVQIKADGTPVLESEQVKARLKAENKLPDKQSEKSALGFFNSRLLLGGFYEYFVSEDRGMIFYTPVMFFGIAGLILAIKRRLNYTALLVAIVGFNVVIYSMWADPYGGWAFGSRYLIPTYAVLSIFLGVLLSKFSKSWLLMAFFCIVLGYSISVNTLGAITTSMNPPKVEAVALEQASGIAQPYTYARNINDLNANNSKSFVFKTVVQEHMSARNYFILLTAFITLIMSGMVIMLQKRSKGVQSHAV